MPRRRRRQPGAAHGTFVPRGQGAAAGRDPPPGRFGKLFDLPACKASPEDLEALAGFMETCKDESKQNSHVPAGITYLGQFIDHDITFDPMSKSDPTDPHTLINFRTPRLDLDSLYGGGPKDQPFLYDWEESELGAKLLIGVNDVGPDPNDPRAPHDLPRNQQGRALIGDPRNDEHAIITQLHLLFLRFHNAVVDHVRKTRPKSDHFEEAQKLVRWHYQWIVVHEFLPLVVGQKMTDDALAVRKFFKWKREPFIPVEFSGAAYRFGHSMARERYLVTRGKDANHPTLSLPLFELEAGKDNLAGQSWLTGNHVLEWDLFFDFKTADPPQLSLAIDTSLSGPLFKLPEKPKEETLPLLNLRRGRTLKLPSGQRLAKEMGERSLKEEQLRLDQLPNAADVVRTSTPLWYYLLCEAAATLGPDDRPDADSHLGPVGGRIVAEVLAGLLQGDPTSYLNADPPFKPKDLGLGPDFSMVDLIDFAGAAPR
jgi:hypothetical protein